MVSSGLSARYEENTLSYGLAVPGYAVDHAAGVDSDAEVDACDRREFFWVSQVYQLQPSSRALVQHYVDQKAPLLRACLEKNGVKLAGNLSGSDLANRASQEMVNSGGKVNCLADVGIDVW
mgnify:CR=1 FL=1